MTQGRQGASMMPDSLARSSCSVVPSDKVWKIEDFDLVALQCCDIKNILWLLLMSSSWLYCVFTVRMRVFRLEF